MKPIVKISNAEIKRLLSSEAVQFPKYASSIINLANKNAQGTRPKVVGQMTELIKTFPGADIKGWERWYLQKHPEAVKLATEKITDMMANLKDVMNKIDRKMIEDWVKDLVIIKTYIGLKFQEAILRKGAELGKCKYTKATPADESKGIDGYIGETPVSIKPDTYKQAKALGETIKAQMIYYKKVSGGIKVDYTELFK